MPTSVRQLIVAAYNRSSQNDAGKLATDAELIIHCDRVYQRVWPLIARARPDQYAARGTLALSGVPAVVALPTGLLDLVQVSDADGAIVHVIPANELTRTWHLAPAMYRVGTQLRSRGQTGDPLAGETLTLLYLDQPAALTTLDSTLDTRWPARHEQLLVDSLALYLAVKDAGRSQGDRQAIAGELAQDVAALAAEFSIPPSNLGWIHADAERSAEDAG